LPVFTVRLSAWADLRRWLFCSCCLLAAFHERCAKRIQKEYSDSPPLSALSEGRPGLKAFCCTANRLDLERGLAAPMSGPPTTLIERATEPRGHSTGRC